MPNRPRVNWELNLGNMLQILLMGSAFGYFVITGNAKNENTATAVTALERRVERGFTEMNGRIDTLAAAVQPIGTLNSRVTETERRLTEQDVRNNAQDARVGLVSEAIAGIRARLDIEARPGRRVTP